MATFLTLKTRVAQEAGLDISTDDSMIGSWVNLSYKHICGLFNWPWLLKPGTIRTVADITTGTVSINADSTALTFSSAPSVSVANQYMIQFTSVSDDWYLISSHTAASTSATLTTAFNGTSNLSGGEYILRKVFYSLPSDLDKVIDLRQAITDIKLTAIGLPTFDLYVPDPTATGDPLAYSMAGLDSNKYWQIGLYPVPSSVINIQLRYLQLPADMSSSTDTPLLPEKYHDVIIYAALYLFGHAFIDDDRYRLAKDRYDMLVKHMKATYNPVPDELHVIQPWDSRVARPFNRLQYPSNYPQYWRY